MINDALAALVKKYAAGLPQKMEKTAECVAESLARPEDAERRILAYRAVHSLVGSSGTYGFNELSETARAAEALLRKAAESGTPVPDEEKPLLQNLMSRMTTLAAGAGQRVSAGAA